MLYSVDEAKESVLVQGIVDLLVFSDKGLIVVDYKTGRISKQAKQKYENQINLYAEAMEKSFNIKTYKKYIASLNTGEFIEI